MTMGPNSEFDDDPFEDWEYRLFLPRLKRELERQIIAPRNVLRLRLYLYSNIDGHPPKRVELFWIKFDALLKAAIEEGEAVQFPNDYHWYLPPDSLEEATQLYSRKKEVYDEWMGTAGSAGYHLEDLVREALRRANYVTALRAVSFPWKGQDLEIDAYAARPVQLVVEVKNVFSETYHHPKVSGMTNELEAIEERFKFALANNMTPILVASLVDRTFYGFQYNYRGLHFCLKNQFFQAKHKPLCEQVRKELLIGNLQACDEPPPYMQRWFDAIPQHYRKQYNTDLP